MSHAGSWRLSALVAAVGAGVFGCDRWPRYLYVEDDDSAQALAPRYFFEDESLGTARTDVETLDALEPLGLLLVYGYAHACGYDDQPTEWPVWPDHPVDDDGDGVPDRDAPIHSGWFTGDVDHFAVTAGATGEIRARLEWENHPDGENAPYTPWDQDGAWLSESDLDLLAFSLAGDSGAGDVLSEEGFEVAYPAAIDSGLFVEEGYVVVFSVACHHRVPTEYTLSVSLDREF